MSELGFHSVDTKRFVELRLCFLHRLEACDNCGVDYRLHNYEHNFNLQSGTIYSQPKTSPIGNENTAVQVNTSYQNGRDDLVNSKQKASGGCETHLQGQNDSPELTYKPTGSNLVEVGQKRRRIEPCDAEPGLAIEKAPLAASTQKSQNTASEEHQTGLNYVPSDHGSQNSLVSRLDGMHACYLPDWDWDYVAENTELRTQQEIMMKMCSLPKPDSSLKTHECQHCELSWAIGRGGQQMASEHPSHNMASVNATATTSPSRSCVVRVAIPNKKRQLKMGSAPELERNNRCGIYFADRSRFNRVITVTEPANSPIPALLRATLTTLEIIASQFGCGPGNGEGASAPRTPTMFRLILATSNGAFVTLFCAQWKVWQNTWNEETGTYTMKSAAHTVEGHHRVIRNIQEYRNSLANMGVQVVFYRTDPTFVEPACLMASKD